MNKRKHHWNFRIVTKKYVGIGIIEQLFSIAEVYYSKGKPDSYIDSKRILQDLESAEGLKWTHKKIKKAFKRAVLDLDNWPHKYKE